MKNKQLISLVFYNFSFVIFIAQLLITYKTQMA